MSKTASGLSPKALQRPAKKKTTALAIPEKTAIIADGVAESVEMDVRSRVRDITDLDVLAPAVEQLNRLSVALAGTKPGRYVRSSARRVEWQIGRVLGPPPGLNGKRSSIAIELSDEEVRQFRLIGTLDLDWEDSRVWDQARLRMIRLAQERRREPSKADPDIRHGDFRKVLADVEPNSVALILTDPPYADANLPLYVDLAKFAAEKLVEGGSLICYTGHTILPAAIPAMSEHVRYWWLLALEHRSGGRQLPGKWIWVGWKPVMWFVKGTRRDRTYVRDVIRGVKPDKELHEWAQGVDEVLPLIERLTEPGELVCDPFAGSGSFGVAALKTGRRFVGADDGGS